MAILIRLVGIVIVGIVIILLIRLDAMRRLFNYVKEQVAVLYVIAIIRIVVGAFLLLAASQSRIPIIILVLGVIFMASGLTIFLVGHERTRKIIDWFSAQSDLVMRLFACIALICGALMIYAA